MELPAFIEELPIPKKEKKYFSNFLAKEVEAYGRRYAEFYKNYYMDFDIEAKSPGALRYVLTQLTLPSSQFMDILLSVRDNTSVDPGQNEYLQSIALRLRGFEFFQRLLEEQKGTFPELNKYKALLEQMQIDMQDRKPVIDDDKEEMFKDFKNRLTPLGRISFAIFRDEPDSYLNLIKLWLKSVGISSQWQDVFFWHRSIKPILWECRKSSWALVRYGLISCRPTSTLFIVNSHSISHQIKMFRLGS